MDALRLTIQAVSGHYGLPTPMSTGSEKSSFPCPTYATLRGSLESLMGLQRGDFEGDIAFGLVKQPGGKGAPLHLNTAYSTIPGWPGIQVAKRPWTWETFYDVEYHVAVRGPLLEHLGQALRGETPRFGVLSLGTSDDEICDIELGEAEAQWIVPGRDFPLIIESQEGRTNRTPKMGRFTLGPRQVAVPEEAWRSFVRAPQPSKKGKSKKG